MKLIDTLGTVAWGMQHFSGVCTGGPLKLRDIRVAVARNFVRSDGMAVPCDADGYERIGRKPREAWVLTDEGRAYFREHDPQTAAVYFDTGKEVEG